MIGDDQAKGYGKDWTKEEQEKQKDEKGDPFEDRKKRALDSIGRGETVDAEKNMTDEEIQKVADLALVNQKSDIGSKMINMQHDLIILRKQMTDIINVLNDLTQAVRDKLTRKP